MRRIAAENEGYRLDNVLKKKAEEGVKIFVVLYEEVEAALALNSNHSKKWLEGLHKNIVGAHFWKSLIPCEFLRELIL